MPRLIVLVLLPLMPIPQANAAVIRNVHIGSSDGYVRVVLEFDRPLSASPYLSIERNHLSAIINGITNTPSPLSVETQPGGIVSLNMSGESATVHFDAIYAFIPADIKTFALTGPHRFIIDAYRPPSSQADSPSVERRPSTRSPQPHDNVPEPYATTEKPTSAALSTTIVKASLNAYDKLASSRPRVADFQRSRFQQRLIAALIVVTTIIIVLLFFLIRIGSGKHRPKDRSWLTDLPPTNDRTIASLDATIRDHLKTYDQT
jgi:hypothetical protein